MPVVVQKYGGMSLASPEHIRAAARRVAQFRASGTNVIVVVSAMGSATDRLIELAYSVSKKPNRRELDMLLSTGERVSMALFSMALADALVELVPNARAISFTGSQAGILTDENHSNARIIDIKSIRVQEELTRGNVVILAGFQGVSPLTKEITTLGRGGTDVTAVALAAAFNAVRCEILKEVPGVLSADPKLVANYRPLKNLSPAQLLDMTFWGAKVLHYRSAELAATHNVPIMVGLAHLQDELQNGQTTENVTNVFKPNLGVKMSPQIPTFENAAVLAVTSHSDVRLCEIQSPSLRRGLDSLRDILLKQNLPAPQILHAEHDDKVLRVFLTAPSEVLAAQISAFKNSPQIFVDATSFATVTATCKGAYATDLVDRLAQNLEEKNISPKKVLFGALSLTFLVLAVQHAEAVTTLHRSVTHE